MNFFQATLDVSSKNSVASAPSAYVTLAALYNGAAGKTDLQLRKVFNIPEKDNVVLVGRDHVNDLKVLFLIFSNIQIIIYYC